MAVPTTKNTNNNTVSMITAASRIPMPAQTMPGMGPGRTGAVGPVSTPPPADQPLGMGPGHNGVPGGGKYPGSIEIEGDVPGIGFQGFAGGAG